MAKAPNVNNYFLGRGIIYFDQLDANDQQTGELDLGNCKEFNLSLTTETLEHFNYREAIVVKDKTVVTQLNAEGTIVIDEPNTENMELMLYGSEGTITQTSGSISNVSHTAYSGKWIRLVDGSGNRIRQVSSVVVTGYDVTDDYTVDGTSGRLYIVPSGDIVDGSSITISCNYGDISLTTTRAFTQNKVEGFIRFIGDPQSGVTYEVEIWKCTLIPDGDIAFIGDDWAELTFRIEVQKQETDHPNEPYFRIIQLDDASGTTTTTTTA